MRPAYLCKSAKICAMKSYRSNEFLDNLEACSAWRLRVPRCLRLSTVRFGQANRQPVSASDRRRHVLLQRLGVADPARTLDRAHRFLRFAALRLFARGYLQDLRLQSVCAGLIAGGVRGRHSGSLVQAGKSCLRWLYQERVYETARKSHRSAGGAWLGLFSTCAGILGHPHADGVAGLRLLVCRLANRQTKAGARHSGGSCSWGD